MEESAAAAACHLPPGFRFLPSDEELVNDFLYRKASALLPFHSSIIPTLDLHLFDPWDLIHSGKALNGAGNYWYFFTSRTQNRETPNGYWKQVGVDELVKEIGIRKSFVFKVGNGLEGMKKDWVMEEFSLVDSLIGSSSSSSNGRKSSKKKGHSRATTDGDHKWVVCRVYEASSSLQQPSSEEDGMELSSLDEVFLSFDDYDEVISFPN